MYSLPGNAYIYAIFILFQGFLVLLVLFLFIDKFFSTRKHRLEADILKQEAYDAAQKELEIAKNQSHKIIADAQITASDIISKSEYISKSTQDKLNNDIKDLVKKQEQDISLMISNFNRELKTEFDREKVTTLAGFNSIFQDLKEESKEQISSYKDMLVKNSLDTEGLLKTQYDKMLEDVRSRISQYEDTQMQKVQDHIFSTILSVSKSFFGRAMTINDHEDLVLKLLEEAKLKETLGV
jgi:F0F1-type ATP synthase membrane subunit b/b'